MNKKITECGKYNNHDKIERIGIIYSTHFDRWNYCNKNISSEIIKKWFGPA